MKPVTVIIVNYNTPGIITRAVKSVSHLDDVMCVDIIDNSDKNNPAYKECDKLSIVDYTKQDWVAVHHTHKNIGHGPALNIGVERAKTNAIIVMDSDAVLIDPSLLQEMYDAIQDEDVYGAGLVVRVNDSGGTDPNGKYNYLHPYFAMFWKYDFLQYSGFINHGAPWLKTMKEIHGKQRVVNIPDIQKKAWHEHRRTRQIAGKSWRQNWDKV